MNQTEGGPTLAAQRAPGESAASPKPATDAKVAAEPIWSSEPLGQLLGEDAAAWDALAARLTQNHPALSSTWVDSWLQNLPVDRHNGRRLIWRGSRATPSAMGLVECLGNQRWRVLAPPSAWTAAMLLGDMSDLRQLATALPGGLRSLDWPRWDASVLPLDLGAVKVAFDLCPVTTARELRHAAVSDANHVDATPDDPMLASIGNVHMQADLRLHLGRSAWLHEWRARPRVKSDANDLRVRCDDGLSTLPPAAVALLDSQNATSLQLGADWLSMMERVLRKDAGSRPCIYSLWRQDRPLAVVAMQSRAAQGVLGARSLHGMSNFYSVLWAPALAPDVRTVELAPLVARLRADAGLMEFSPVDLAAPSMWTWVEALREGGLVVLRHPAFANWTHAASSDSKAYLAGRTGQLRRMIKRGNQRLKERGGHLEILTSAEDMPRAMDAYEAVYARSWKQAEPHPEFFRELARRWAPLDRMRIGVAWLDGAPIAAQWWTCHAGVAEIHKLAYDESHSELGAGTALSAALFTYVLDHDRVQKIDYLIGDDAYKQLWMSTRRFRCRLLVFDPRSAAGAAGLLREAASRARRAWRESRARHAPAAT